MSLEFNAIKQQHLIKLSFDDLIKLNNESNKRQSDIIKTYISEYIPNNKKIDQILCNRNGESDYTVYITTSNDLSIIMHIVGLNPYETNIHSFILKPTPPKFFFQEQKIKTPVLSIKIMGTRPSKVVTYKYDGFTESQCKAYSQFFIDFLFIFAKMTKLTNMQEETIINYNYNQEIDMVNLRST